ncbi:MAG: hypothetical protein KDK70_38065 [Myxococcales bacterium]|nr:hypothetical protein [Myxococcales bacterium]
MSAPQSSIVDQALDLVDGIYGLVDIAFAHDLAVVFSDVGSHDAARSITSSLVTLLTGIHEELPRTEQLGTLGALLGMIEPFVTVLHELLLEAGHQLGTRAVFAVLRTRRPVELAFAHLRTAARMGATQPVDDEPRTSLRLAVEALLGNLASFADLLGALDPLPPELIESLPRLPHK